MMGLQLVKLILEAQQLRKASVCIRQREQIDTEYHNYFLGDMTSQSDNEKKHSTLQLFSHNQSGNAPERMRETAAIELDSTATTPQVAFHTAPETRYSSCLPEVVDSHRCENRDESAPKSAYNRRLLKIMLFTILALFLAVAIGIGVEIGVTRSKAQQEFPYHETILEGSSLAGLAPPNGPRRLFFQGRNGNIIQALFQASENKWNTEVVACSHARNHTPISAIISDGSLYLFYYHVLGYVGMASYQINRAGWSFSFVGTVDGEDLNHGGWSSDLVGIVDGKDKDFTTTNANATSLSATSTLGPGNKTNISILYKNLNGDMIMIRWSSSGGIWRDISPELRSVAPYALLRSPFSSGSIMAGRSEIIVTQPKIPSDGPFAETCMITYQNETFTTGGNVVLPGKDHLPPNANDGRPYILSIDKPAGKIYFSGFNMSSDWQYTGLNGQFPFSKAAALFSEQNGTLIVYHQANNLSIAEKMWDWNLGWTNGT